MDRSTKHRGIVVWLSVRNIGIVTLKLELIAPVAHFGWKGDLFRLGENIKIALTLEYCHQNLQFSLADQLFTSSPFQLSQLATRLIKKIARPLPKYHGHRLSTQQISWTFSVLMEAPLRVKIQTRPIFDYML